MDEFIKKQLRSTKVAVVPEFDDTTTTLIIKKLANIPLIENHCYLIKLKDNLLEPNNTTSLTLNWNNGSIPTHKN